jgi:hypothetical protein
LANTDVIPIVRVVKHPSSSGHQHEAVKVHLLRQQHGIPYEVERTMCAACRAVLEEKPLRRAAA